MGRIAPSRGCCAVRCCAIALLRYCAITLLRYCALALRSPPAHSENAPFQVVNFRTANLRTCRASKFFFFLPHTLPFQLASYFFSPAFSSHFSLFFLVSHFSGELVLACVFLLCILLLDFFGVGANMPKLPE